MPRDYDEMRASRDLAFVIAGQTFEMKMAPAELIASWDEREKDAQWGESGTVTKLADERILDVLVDDESRERWKALRQNGSGPSYGELVDLMRWVVEVQTGLPTMPPVDSPDGPGKTTGSSKGASA